VQTRWDALLATPGGAGRVARGAAAGAFAAMIPAFGLHLALALGTALLARGSLAAAAAACLLIGNPLVHAIELPLAYELGRWLIPAGFPEPGWLPAWTRTLLPVAEEALAGGALLGATAALPAFFGVRRALAARAARRGSGSKGPRCGASSGGGDLG
jgi:uncharacterized protein